MGCLAHGMAYQRRAHSAPAMLRLHIDAREPGCQVEVNAPLEAYRTGDPTLEKGLDILRAKVAALHAVK